jgi:hypothetical protein
MIFNTPVQTPLEAQVVVRSPVVMSFIEAILSGSIAGALQYNGENLIYNGDTLIYTEN